MVYLLVLFFVSQIGFWLRFVIKGIFDLQQFALSCLFLVAALILFIITLRQSKRDIGFQPVEQLEWQTKITEYMKTSQKKLTRNTEVIFIYERYYKTI